MAFGTPTGMGSMPKGLDLTFESNMVDESTTVALQEPKNKTAVEAENLKYSPLTHYVMSRFHDSKDARKSDEARWLESYRNYRGLYGPDVQFTSTEQSRAFIKITKTKVNASYAQVTEILFSGNRFPIQVGSTPVPEDIEESVHFDPGAPENAQAGAAPEMPSTVARPELANIGKSLKPVLEPIQDKLKSGTSAAPTAMNWEPAKTAAKKMDRQIQDQLEESNAAAHLRSFTFEQTLFGTGLMKGPILIDKEYPKWDETGAYIPVFKPIPDIQHVSIWDAYPDPDARNMAEAEFFIQRHRMSKTQLRQLKKRPFFRGKSINQAIERGPNYTEEYWENTLRDDRFEGPNERFEVIEYWGLADKDLKDIADIEIPEQFRDLDEVQINAWVCNGELIRLVFNPFTPARIPYYACPYELNPYSFFGIGIAENMSDTQLLMNGFMRLAVDNGILSSNVIFEVNENQLAPGQDFQLHPGKIFRTNGQVGQSIFATKFPNVTQECMLLFDKARQLADEATGIPSYSHGMTGVMGVGRTASGMSMLMGAAKENTKSVIRNIDDYLLMPLGKALFAFNMQFNFDKEFIGDLDVSAMGTESLMRNEIRSQKLLQFAQMTNNPTDIPWVKRDYLIRELADSMDLDSEKLVNDPREAAIQAEMTKVMMLAQGIDPNAQPAAQGSVPGAGMGNPAETGTPGQPGAAPPPGAQGFSGGGGGSNAGQQAPQAPQ